MEPGQQWIVFVFALVGLSCFILASWLHVDPQVIFDFFGNLANILTGSK